MLTVLDADVDRYLVEHRVPAEGAAQVRRENVLRQVDGESTAYSYDVPY
jgi:hypothetical protein